MKSRNSRQSLIVVDRFYPHAKKLRAHFEDRFADPRSNDSGRFVWDYWHVPGQYTVLRTPAYHYFPRNLYRPLHEALAQWGRRNLGCHDISPPWMSCYVDGCRQEIHSDLPHGPFAFVLSLTPWEARRFIGGETMILREEMLNFWSNLDHYAGSGLEENEVFQTVPSLFNRLVVFDPRVPHLVRRVEGAADPRDGRLVIHGWFMQPRPYIEGPLGRSELQKAIPGIVQGLSAAIGEANTLRGIASFRFKVTPAGRVNACKLVASTLIATDGDKELVSKALASVPRSIKALRFRARSRASDVTLPLIFDR